MQLGPSSIIKQIREGKKSEIPYGMILGYIFDKNTVKSLFSEEFYEEIMDSYDEIAGDKGSYFVDSLDFDILCSSILYRLYGKHDVFRVVVFKTLDSNLDKDERNRICRGYMNYSMAIRSVNENYLDMFISFAYMKRDLNRVFYLGCARALYLSSYFLFLNFCDNGDFFRTIYDDVLNDIDEYIFWQVRSIFHSQEQSEDCNKILEECSDYYYPYLIKAMEQKNYREGVASLIEETIEKLELPKKEFDSLIYDELFEIINLPRTLRKIIGLDSKQALEYREYMRNKKCDIPTKSYSRSSALSEKRMSVTARAKAVYQPNSGYLNISEFETIEGVDDNILLYSKENVRVQNIGLAVDYLTRIHFGVSKEEAFKISLIGAELADELETANKMLESITGTDEVSIENALKLSMYDDYKNGDLSEFTSPAKVKPNDKTICNVKIMVERTCNFFEKNGPVIKTGYDFEGGYTAIIASGVGDILTADTLWDIKVLKRFPTKNDTLQLLMYWRMGLHSKYDEYKQIKYIGIFNPRKNQAYRIAVDSISEAVISDVERDVIGYRKNKD